jgi:hypothetical protein
LRLAKILHATGTIQVSTTVLELSQIVALLEQIEQDSDSARKKLTEQKASISKNQEAVQSEAPASKTRIERFIGLSGVSLEKPKREVRYPGGVPKNSPPRGFFSSPRSKSRNPAAPACAGAADNRKSPLWPARAGDPSGTAAVSGRGSRVVSQVEFQQWGGKRIFAQAAGMSPMRHFRTSLDMSRIWGPCTPG